MHDIIADLEIRERNGYAFFDGTDLDAFGRLPVDLTVAQNAQTQVRNREAGFDAPVIDQNSSVAPAKVYMRGCGALRFQSRGADHVTGTSGARRHEQHGI